MTVKQNVSSILTNAMKNADQADTQVETDPITLADEMIEDFDRAARKQFWTKAALITLGGAAAVYIASRLLSSSDDSDEETETDADAQD